MSFQSGETQLMFGARNGNVSPSFKEIVNNQDRYGNTALTYAIRGVHLRAVVELLKMGANPLIPNNCGETAIDQADRLSIAFTPMFVVGGNGIDDRYLISRFIKKTEVDKNEAFYYLFKADWNFGKALEHYNSCKTRNGIVEVLKTFKN